VTQGSAVRTRRFVVRIAAQCVLAIAVVIGVSWAAIAWSTPVYDGAGELCASAWHFHPGSGYLVKGGDLSDEQRTAITRECDPHGAGPWRTGWLALGGGVVVAAACTAVLVVTRGRQSLDASR